MPKSLLASAKYPHQAHQSPQSPAMIASPEHLHHHHAAAATAHHQHHHQAYYSPSHHVNMQQQQQYQDQMQQQQQHHYTNGYGRSANLMGGSSPSHMQMSPSSSSSAKSPYFASPSLLPPNSQSSQQQQSNGQQQHSPHNYIDANNNAQSAANSSGNGLLFNSKALQHLNNTNLGGVINNLINSSLIHNPAAAAAAAAGNASTPSAAAVAAASTAAATAYLLNQSAQNSHNNNHANASATAAAAANLILANLAAAASQSAVAAAANSAAVAAAAAASNGGNQYTVDESKCHVCGDKSTGSHFGGISCESCKAFFRRSVQRNRFEDYKCSYNGECKMNTNTRKICQFCRYKSCLAIGMRPKWVLSDDERHQKYGSRRKQNKPKPGETSTNTTTSGVENEIIDTNSNNGMLKQQPQTPQSQQQQQQQGGGSDEENSTPSPKDSNQSSGTSYSQSQQKSSELSRVGIDGIDMRTHALHLNSYEKDLIDRLSVAFYHSRKHNTIDLNVNKKMAMLFQTQSEGSLKKMSKVILANFIVQPVKRVITFAKLIPDFRKLDIHDQMCLLQGGTMEIFIMSSSSLYDQMSNKFDNMVSKDRNIKGNDTSSIQLDMFRLIWSEDVFEKTIGFLKSMMEMRIDEATLILILPLILFSPDRRDLKNRHKIYINQAKYSLLLKKYLIWKYGLNQETMKLYNRLLLKLIELRTLHEMHSSILLDADPTQLEPFPLALILNEKEDARHFKSDETPGGETTPPTTGDQVTQPTSGDTNSRPNETDTETAPASVQHSMPPTPLTASSLNAPQTVTSGSVPSKDQFSSTSILTPSSNGGYSSGSTGGQLSSVSSPTTALESPFMADTPHTNASTNIGSCTSSNSMVNSNSCHVDEHLVD